MTAAPLVITIIQTVIFCLIGPITLFAGVAGFKFTTFIHAATASGWLDFVNSVKAIDDSNVFFVWNQFVMFFSGTLALGIAAVSLQWLNYTMKGMVTFYILADVPLKILATTLFTNVANCDKFGEPTLVFPNGMPEGGADCQPGEPGFLAALYISEGIKWIVTLFGGYMGNVLQRIIGPWSLAVLGATMTVRSCTELIFLIMTRTGSGNAEALVAAIGGVECFLIYGLAGLGYLVQQVAYPWVEADKQGLPPPEPKGFRRHLIRGPTKFLLRKMLKIEHFTGELLDGKYVRACCPQNAVKAVLKTMQPVFEPKLEKVGLAWADILPILQTLDTVEEVQKVGEQIIADPQGFIEKQADQKAYMRVAIKLVIFQVRPSIEPKLGRVGLEWADVLAILEAPETFTEVKDLGEQMARDPVQFIQEKANDPAHKHIAKKMQKNKEASSAVPAVPADVMEMTV